MDLATIAVEVGIAVAGVIGTALVYSFRAGKLTAEIDQLKEKLAKHIEVDEKHHQEEQGQWQENNRSLGQIEGALGLSNNNPRKSKPR